MDSSFPLRLKTLSLLIPTKKSSCNLIGFSKQSFNIRNFSRGDCMACKKFCLGTLPRSHRLQFFVLSHLADLVKIFSGSRVVKLFEDVAELLSWSTCSESCDPLEKISFKISCWRGLTLCLDESSHQTQDYKSGMELLFTLLPSAHTEGPCQGKFFEEWSEAIRCLEKAQQGSSKDSLSFETVRNIQAKVKLVQSGSLPLTVLGKLKACVLDCISQGSAVCRPAMWQLLYL
ncbi:hypothetical protein K7X08_018940 [Anisodus acutangulus]|uniref:Uncharacterized protein n=1 Tax=Anisodus acutangulus TaxID=402998 RepID=A0A9Q1LX19_9SOLA|nr:hypothetical protein K7X08_018940 [Anisodus acutangulus]